VAPSIKTPYSFGGGHKPFQQHTASESGKVADRNIRRRTGVGNENHELPTERVNGYVFEFHFVKKNASLKEAKPPFVLI